MNMTSRFEARARATANAHAVFGLKDELIALRKKHELSQDEVADRMGVTQPTVSQLERDDSNPTLRTVQKYANAVMGALELNVKDDCCPATRWNTVTTNSAESAKSRVRPLRYDASWDPASKTQRDFGLAW